MIHTYYTKVCPDMQNVSARSIVRGKHWNAICEAASAFDILQSVCMARLDLQHRLRQVFRVVVGSMCESQCELATTWRAGLYCTQGQCFVKRSSQMRVRGGRVVLRQLVTDWHLWGALLSCM